MPKATVTSPESNKDVYDIAAVCRLTGLSAPNLRMWEKRHQAVAPERSETGRRQYARHDIQRLTLLKALSDHGHGIRTLVGLPLAELEKRLEESARGQSTINSENGLASDVKARTCRMVVVGAHLRALLESDGAFPPGAALVREYEDVAAAEEVGITVKADLLLLEIPALFAEDLNRVRRLLNQFKALRAIIVYAYARQKTIEDMARIGGMVTAIRAPISLAELRSACAADIVMANRSSNLLLEGAAEPREFVEGISARRFSQRHLARISNILSTVECECPHHLAGLLEALNSFEEYSAKCENRSEADAKMHAYLYRMTAHARATMEEALRVLLEFENIDVRED